MLWRKEELLLNLLQVEGSGEDRMGGIMVELVELGTGNSNSIREPMVRNRGQRAKSRRKWKEKISWEEEQLLQP